MITLFNPKNWVKLAFAAALSASFLSSCANEMVEETSVESNNYSLDRKQNPDLIKPIPLPTPVEDSRVNGAVFMGTWNSTYSDIEVSLSPLQDPEGYKGLNENLLFASPKYSSKLTLNSNGTYMLSNGVIGEGSRTVSGTWSIDSQADKQLHLRLEGLYAQLLQGKELDKDLYNDVLYNQLEDFKVESISETSMELSNHAIVFENMGPDMPPVRVVIDGNFVFSK